MEIWVSVASDLSTALETALLVTKQSAMQSGVVADELPALRKRNQRRGDHRERLDAREGSKLSRKRKARGTPEETQARSNQSDW